MFTNREKEIFEELLNDKISKISFVASKFNYNIYKILFITKKSFIVKETSDDLIKSKLRNEIQVCKILKNTDKNIKCIIPKEYILTKTKSVFVQNFINGKELYKFLLENKNNTEWIDPFICNLKKISNVKLSKEDSSLINNEINWNNMLLNKTMNAFNIVKSNTSFINKNKILNMFDIVLNKISKLEIINNKCILHNDLHGANIIVASGNKKIFTTSEVYFIDFSEFLYGDSLWDIRKIFWILKSKTELSDIFWKKYLKNFPNASYERAQLYFCIQILYNITKHNKLCNYSTWKKEFNSSFEILTNLLL